MIQCIDGKKFRDMFVSGANNLQNNKDLVDKLNVFPVPDGDTGTNMSMTFRAAVKEIEGMDNKNIGEVSKKLAKGALMGARGNSGVILSQLLRGFTKTIEHYDTVDAPAFAKAFEKGVGTAYKAVMKPKEGTILTVAKGAA